jgi:tetratricopeptide (TPR) repeat protein
MSTQAPAGTTPPERRETGPLVRELLDLMEPEEDPWLLPIEVLLDRAERMLDRTTRESVERAAELYQFVLKEDEDSALAHAGTARTMTIWYSRRWKDDDRLVAQALAAGRRAVEHDPEEPQTHAALSYALMAAEEWSEALQSADRAWALRGDGTPTWVTSVYAQSLLARSDEDGALRVLEEALRARPDRAQLHMMHGQILIEKKEYLQAVRALRRAVLLEPDFAPALVRAAYAMDRAGDRERAGSLYEEIVRRFPEEKNRVFLLMATSLMHRKEYDRALYGLGQIQFKTERGLSEGTRLYLMASCHHELGKREEARELYLDVVRNHPQASFGSFTGRSAGVAAYEGLARLALEEDDTPRAVKRLEEALSLGHPSVEIFLRLARMYEDHNLHREAIDLLARGAGTEFGAHLAGKKVALFLAWARAVRRHGEEERGRFEPILEGLDRHVESLLSTGDYTHFVEAARACALCGSPDRGIEWLRRAVERGYRKLDWIAGDEEMGSLAGHPGFEALRATLARP